jgi:hypothetical protein
MMWRCAGVVLVALGASGCVGEGQAKYKGAVVSAPQAGYSFVERLDTAGSAPVSGALVVLVTGSEKSDCSHVEAERKNAGHKPANRAVTDPQGRYEVSMIFGGMLGVDTYLTVCVRHPEYQKFEYSTIFEKSREPRHGEKFLIIRLEPVR